MSALFVSLLQAGNRAERRTFFHRELVEFRMVALRRPCAPCKCTSLRVKGRWPRYWGCCAAAGCAWTCRCCCAAPGAEPGRGAAGSGGVSLSRRSWRPTGITAVHSLERRWMHRCFYRTTRSRESSCACKSMFGRSKTFAVLARACSIDLAFRRARWWVLPESPPDEAARCGVGRRSQPYCSAAPAGIRVRVPAEFGLPQRGGDGSLQPGSCTM